VVTEIGIIHQATPMAKPRHLSPHLVSNQFSAAPGVIDTAGNLIKDPLLVMRSISVEDACEQLDALYDASPAK